MAKTSSQPISILLEHSRSLAHRIESAIKVAPAQDAQTLRMILHQQSVVSDALALIDDHSSGTERQVRWL